MTLGGAVKAWVKPLRLAAARFAMVPDAAALARRLEPIRLAADFVCSEHVPGDYLEFGVFRGASFVTAYRALTEAVADWGSRHRTGLAYTDQQRADEAFAQMAAAAPRRFFAFDSFDGLPELSGIDQGAARFRKGRYDCSEANFRRILTEQGVDLRSVVTVPGFYQDSLMPEMKRRHQLTTAAIVMIDCDLYESTKPVLEFITDLIGDGTVLIFDDWFNFRASPDRGEQRACREWLQRHPNIRLVPFARWGVVQQAFIVSRQTA